jgi:CheY-like chemotaxis protein
MPLVDGAASTRMIRTFEKECCPPITQQAKSYGRIPIIAVSASLLEQARDSYIDIGFDGWILKPIDFKRLESILAATQDEQIRALLLYGNESWEKGGWFKVKVNNSI